MDIKTVEKNIKETINNGWDNIFECPSCLNEENESKYVNLGKSQVGYCEDCNISWSIGYKLVSTWKDETEEHWERNLEFIKQFNFMDEFIKQFMLEKINDTDDRLEDYSMLICNDDLEIEVPY